MTAGLRTIADLLRDIGGIPADRVRLRPAPGKATLDDVIQSEADDNRLCELVDGVLVEKAIGFRESILAVFLIRLLEKYVAEHDLGVVTSSDGMMEISSGLVRIPDVAYISWRRFPNRKIPATPIPALAPDFAIEVLSASNTLSEMRRKRNEYFAAGVQLIWEVDPSAKSVAVYTEPESPTIFFAPCTITAAPVLPDFSVSLLEWFRRID